MTAVAACCAAAPGSTVPRYLRPGARFRFDTGDRGNYIGFRVARTLD